MLKVLSRVGVPFWEVIVISLLVDIIATLSLLDQKVYTTKEKEEELSLSPLPLSINMSCYHQQLAMEQLAPASALVLGTHTQSNTKLCEQLRFYIFDLMSFIYEENIKNIMNCIVLVQTVTET